MNTPQHYWVGDEIHQAVDINPVLHALLKDDEILHGAQTMGFTRTDQLKEFLALRLKIKVLESQVRIGTPKLSVNMILERLMNQVKHEVLSSWQISIMDTSHFTLKNPESSAAFARITGVRNSRNDLGLTQRATITFRRQQSERDILTFIR